MHKDTDSGYYSYEGSLTTPPCTEGVQWVVLDQVVEVTKADLEFFKVGIPHPCFAIARLCLAFCFGLGLLSRTGLTCLHPPPFL